MANVRGRGISWLYSETTKLVAGYSSPSALHPKNSKICVLNRKRNPCIMGKKNSLDFFLIMYIYYKHSLYINNLFLTNISQKKNMSTLIVKLWSFHHFNQFPNLKMRLPGNLGVPNPNVLIGSMPWRGTPRDSFFVNYLLYIWMFPKIVVPPNHPF